MKDEIDRDFYCSAHFYDVMGICRLHGAALCCNIAPCSKKHRKLPTPEQFLQEYGEEYSDDGAVYWRIKNGVKSWLCGTIEELKDRIPSTIEELLVEYEIICACTPWGKPPEDWRPE